jgi:RHS repeat-associated protein
MNFITSSYDQSSQASKTGFEQLSLQDVLVPMEGYMFIYVSNQEEQANIAYFDDIKVEHKHSPVLQSDDYYPGGLTFNSYQRSYSKKNKMNTFQDQEYDEETGWIQFKWRNHIPELGRFFNVDPLAESFYYNSPYAFSENKVTNHIELEGLEAYSAQAAFNQSKRDLENQLNYVGDNIRSGLNRMGEGLENIGPAINGGLKAADKFLNSFAVSQPAPSPEKSDLHGETLIGSHAGNGPARGGVSEGEIDVSLLQDAWGFGPPPSVPANTGDIVKTAVSEAVNVVTNSENLVNEVKELVNNNSNTKPVKPDSMDIEYTVIKGSDTSSHVQRIPIN